MSVSSKVAALVVTFNSADVIDECLAALDPLPVAVVDNASSDDTVRRVARHGHAELVQNPANAGFAAAVNQGLALLQGLDVFIANPDLLPTADGVAALHDVLARNEDAGLAAPRLLGADGKIQPSARTFQTPATIWARRTSSLHEQRRREVLEAHFAPSYTDAESDVPWIIGAAMLVRRAALDEVGGMDEGFFLYHEDQDWCIRMWLERWRVVLAPTVSMQHRYQRASGRILSAAARHHLASTVRFYRKYPSLLRGTSPLVSSRRG